MDEYKVEPAQLPVGVTPKAASRISMNIVTIIGIAVLSVIIGSIVLAWFDKTVPEAVLTMGGVALGYLGNVIVGGNSDASKA